MAIVLKEKPDSPTFSINANGGSLLRRYFARGTDNEADVYTTVLAAAFPSEKLKAAARVITGVRGQFGGANAAQAFGIGDKGVQEKQLGVMERMDEKLGKIDRGIQDLDGVAFA